MLIPTASTSLSFPSPGLGEAGSARRPVSAAWFHPLHVYGTQTSEHPRMSDFKTEPPFRFMGVCTRILVHLGISNQLRCLQGRTPGRQLEH